MTDIVERLRIIEPDAPGSKSHCFRNPDGPEAADEIERLREALSAMTELFKATEASAQFALSEVELMRHALECVVLYWDEWKDAPEDHPTALSLEEVVDICRPFVKDANDA